MLFENLESRRLMSFTWSVSADGVLTVDGTGGDDHIDVRDMWVMDSTGETIVRDNRVEITERSLVDSSVVVNVEIATNVTKGIVLNLYDGYNQGSIDTGGVEAVYNGGADRDDFTVKNNGAPFAVYTRAGGDVIIVNDYAHVGTIVLAGNDNDTIEVHKSSSSSLSPTVVYAGSGDDELYGERPEEAELLYDDEGITVIGIVYHDAVFGHARLYGGKGKDYLVSYHEDTWIDGEQSKDEEVIFREDADRLDAMTV